MGLNRDASHAAIKVTFGAGVSPAACYTARLNVNMSIYTAMGAEGIELCAGAFCERDHVQSKGTLRAFLFGEEVFVQYGRGGPANVLAPTGLVIVPRSRYMANSSSRGSSTRT
jgi:hypothetical protein